MPDQHAPLERTHPASSQAKTGNGATTPAPKESEFTVTATHLELACLPASTIPDPKRPLVPSNEAAAINTRAYWADRLNHRFATGATWVIETGCDLIEAKNRLPHGEFEQLFKNGEVKMSLRTAEMFMRVAGNPALSKTNTHSLLPPALNSLYVLSGLDERKLQRALTTNKVSPTMKTAEAKALVQKLNGGKAKPSSANVTPGPTAYNLDSTIKRVADLLEEEFAQCPNDATRQELAAKLIAYLEAAGLSDDSDA